MHILTIRTDQPEAELTLFNDTVVVERFKWHAHRQLAETIHQKIDELLALNSYKLKDIEGIVLFKGPGSFTGLRIGASVANALAVALDDPIVGAVGDTWEEEGIAALLAGNTDVIVVPEYGSPARTTVQKK